jgi:5-methyltetrahydropteroyltriglutamate--homocysteine methyltransferase
LPDDRTIVLGTVDPKNIHIEHPEVVAQRIECLARIVGRERVMAAPDCGFGTFVGSSPLIPAIADAKLAALSEGARLASERLWSSRGSPGSVRTPAATTSSSTGR